MGLNILHYYNKTKFKTSYQTTSKVFKKRFLVGNNPIENMAHVVKEEHTEIGITIGITCKSKMLIMKGWKNIRQQSNWIGKSGSFKKFEKLQTTRVDTYTS